MLNKIFFDIGLAHHAARGQFESVLEQIKEWPLHVGYSIEGKRQVHPPLVLTNLLPGFGTNITYAEFVTIALPQSNIWAEGTLRSAQYLELLGDELPRPFAEPYEFRFREGRGGMDGLEVDFVERLNRVSSRHKRADVYALPKGYSFENIDPAKCEGRHRKGMDEFRFVGLVPPSVVAEVN